MAAWQVVLEAGLLQSDIGLQRAACERLFVISKAVAAEDAIRYYADLDRRLGEATGEPTYALDGEYTSCEWIQGGLTYDVDMMTACCIPNQGGAGGWEPLAHYKPDSKPALLEFVRAKQRMRHAAQSGGVDNCKGCSRLVRRTWRSELFLIDTLNFSHFHRCNLRCNYCYLEQPDYVPNDKALRDPNDLEHHVRYWARTGLLSKSAVVYWGGGEPTILKDFESVLTELLRHGCRNVINTNGIRYSPAVEKALQTPGQMVVCSLDAGTRETYKAKKKADVFDKVVRHCARYAASMSGGVLALKYIVDLDNHSEEETASFIEVAAETVGVREVILDVNSYNDSLSDEMVAAMGRLARDLDARGVLGRIGGCGVFGYPELDVHGRLQSELQGSSTLSDDAIRRVVGGG